MAGANFANRTLPRGGSLRIVRGADGGAVDPIAASPPFHKGRNFRAAPGGGWMRGAQAVRDAEVRGR